MIQDHGEVVKGIVTHNRLVKDNIEVRTQLKGAQMDRDRLQHECDRVSDKTLYYITYDL